MTEHLTHRLGPGNEFEPDKASTGARDSAEAALEALRQRGGGFVDAVRATRMAMVLTDPALPGNPIIFANQSFLDLSGYRMEEVLGQQPHFMDGIGTDPEDARRFRHILENDRDGVIETIQYGKGGRRFVATVLLSAFKDDSGKTLHHFLSWGDVTRRAEAEDQVADLRVMQAALRQSEAKYRTLFESIDDGFCIIEVLFDARGRASDFVFIETNPAFEKQAGFAIVPGQRMREIAPGHEQVWFDVYGDVALSGKPARFEHPADSFGTVHDVYAFRVDEPASRRVAVLLRNITERKRAELALRESEARFRLAIEGSKIAVDECDLDLRYTWVANAAPGWKASDAVGRTDAELLPPDYAARLMDFKRRALEADAAIEEEMEGLPGQTPQWFLRRAEKLRAAGGAVTGLRVLAIDISQLKEVERSLGDSERQLAAELRQTKLLHDLATRMVTQGSLPEAYDQILAAAVDIMDSDAGTLQVFDPASSSLMLLSARGIPSMMAEHFPQVHAGSSTACGQALRTGRRSFVDLDRDESDEAGWLHFEAGLRSAQATPLLARDGTPIGMINTHWRVSGHRPTVDQLRFFDLLARQAADLIERRRGEEALRRSETRLAAAFRSVPLGLAVIDLDGHVALANERFRRFIPTGIIPSRDPARVDRWRAWDVAGRPIEPNDFPSARALRGESVIPGTEMLYTDDDGREVWTTVATAPTSDADGNVTGLVSVISDVDALKRSTDALRESEERLSLAVQVGQFASWDWDLRTDAITWNDRHFIVQGYAVGEVTPSFEAWLGRVHPDDRSEAVAAIAKARGSGGAYGHDFRVLHPDGTVRWCTTRGRFFYDAGGKPCRMIGVMEDVTERKRAENALRESEERLRRFGEASQDALWIRDAATLQWQYLTPAFETIYGVRREEALAGDNFCNWTGMILPEDRAGAVASIERVRQGEPVTFEYRIRRTSDGEIRWLRDTDFPIFDEAGNVARIGGIGQDVTKDKATADRMAVLVGELQHRTRNLMGVVRSTANRTGEASVDLPDFQRRFQDRLDALARVQGLLSRLGETDRVAFDELIRSEFSAMQGVDDRVTISGPAGIHLRSSTVQLLAMALHELATNALKYGALGQSGAQLAVSWYLEEADPAGRQHLRIEWRESGVAMPPRGAAPRGGGQGRELIEKALPYQLHARTSFELGPDGVHCTITVPVSERSIAGAAGD